MDGVDRFEERKMRVFHFTSTEHTLSDMQKQWLKVAGKHGNVPDKYAPPNAKVAVTNRF